MKLIRTKNKELIIDKKYKLKILIKVVFNICELKI